MENNQTHTGEQAYVLTSTRETKVSFKSVPIKTRLKLLFGGNIWITTKAQIQVLQDNEPKPINDGIELFINTNKDGK